MTAREVRSEKAVRTNADLACIVGLRLLLVEDDPDSREAMTSMLAKRGLTVTEAVDAERALEELQAHPFDAVLADVRLPGMNGVDLLVEIRKRDGILPVLLITAYADVTVLRRAVAYNVQDYLLKPLDSIEDALEPLRKAVAHHRLALERDRLEVELRASEEEFRKLFDNANDMLCLYEAPENGLPGRFLEVNAAVCSHLGYTPEELKRMSPADVMPPESVRAIAENLRQAGANGRAPLECACRGRDGSLVPVEIGSHLFELAGRKVVLSIARDISERRQTDEKIALALEEQKAAMGRELHDVLTMNLTSILTWTQMLDKELAARMPRRPKDLARIEESARRALDFTRYLSSGLLPLGIDEDTIDLALRELANDYARMFDVRCEFRSAGNVKIADRPVRLHVYRLAQEALSNAVKHAKATHITVTLHEGKHDIVLEVRDDGVGIAEKSAKGFGLRIMEHRAKLIGGSLEIVRGTGRGTRVRLACPRAESSREAQETRAAETGRA